MRRVFCMIAALMLAACAAYADDYAVEDDGDEAGDAGVRLEARARVMIEGMSAREKICQLFIVTPEAVSGQTVVTVADGAFFDGYARTPVGGLIYYARNLISRGQVSDLIGSIDARARENGCAATPFHAIDEEGGDVARAAYRLGTSRYPSMRELGREPDAEGAYDIGTTMARELSALGFNVNFAPVADVSGGDNAAIGGRSFGASAEMTAAMSSAVARGMQDHGLIAVMKHFPGHGSVTGNVHLRRSTDSRPLDAFRASDFIPFRAGVDLGVGMVMMSDMVMQSVSQAPACLSREVVALLRDELHYDGVIVTDALRMDAVTESYSSAEAALMAIEAGCDMILLPKDLESAVSALEKAVASGRLSEARIEQSLMRIFKLKLAYGIY